MIDPGGYVLHRGEPTVDPARDAAYTRGLGEVLSEHYRTETILMSTQVVAHILFRQLVQATPGLDLFSRVRLRNEISVDRETLHRELGQARDRLLALQDQGMVRVSPVVREDSPEELLNRALTSWDGYHSSTAVTVDGDLLTISDPSLLLYYQNRLVDFAEQIADESQMQAASEIGKLRALA